MLQVDVDDVGLPASNLALNEPARPPMWVVIPAHNEEHRIGQTLDDYLAGLGDNDRVVVVVNGSSDATAEICLCHREEDHRLIVVVEPEAIGKGAAVVRGLSFVHELGQHRDIAGYADADGAVAIGDLVHLAADLGGGQLVIGSRWLDRSMQLRRQPLPRRIASRVFNRVVRSMLAIDFRDTQCAAKVMQVGDIPHLARRVTATGFGFDVDLLMAAREAGMTIFERPILWTEMGGSSVRMRRAVPAMLQEVATVRRKYRDRAPHRHPGLPDSQKLLLDRPLADRVLTRRQQLGAVVAVGSVALGLWFAPMALIIGVNAAMVAFYMVANLFKFLLLQRSLGRRREIRVTAAQLADLDPDSLPIYTVLIPVYREAAVLPQLVEGIRHLDYPSSKLDVKILLEADDSETLSAVTELRLPEYFEVLTVPDVLPRGKPRACNHGLTRARGEHLVIYDAEDRPDPDQLLKAVWTFRNSPSDVICLQAKLNFFNRNQNVLTRWFTAEYSMWFDLLLPGLYSLDVAIPLGGTSNHFITAHLRTIGAWDPYNVTEDADLGIRLFSRGWKTAVIDSTTYEEATSRTYNWIRQRSRWTKGYVQTYLFHMRHPGRLYQAHGLKAFAVFQLFLGGNVLTLLANPIYWVLTAAWFLTHAKIIHSAFPPVVLYAGVLALAVGNFTFVMGTMAGCVRRRHYEDVKWAVLSPFYWVLMSAAAWKGFLQLFYKPFYWEKTTHGHYLLSDVADQHAGVENRAATLQEQWVAAAHDGRVPVLDHIEGDAA